MARMAGLLLTGKGVLRSHQVVHFPGGETGETTSGSYSPTIARSIALARIPANITSGTDCQVDIRGRMIPARVVKYPFVRNGKVLIDTEE